MNFLIAVCLAGLVAASCVAGYPQPQRVRRCTDGDCEVYIGGRNSGRITGAHRVYEGGNPQGGSYGGSGYGSYNSGNQWYPQQQGSGSGHHGSYGTPQYGQPQPNRPDSVYVPGNNNRNINL